MNRGSFFLFRFTAALLLSLTIRGAEAQFNRGVQMNFGKNRVQYNDFLWTFYRFNNFDTYFYLGGQELAIYAGRTADADIAEIEKLFDYRINGRFQFMIYNRLSDLRQSNVGLEGEEQNINTGGLTRIVGNKVLVYFDGDYRHFREQIRAGVAQVMINQLMYGGNIKDRLQSSVLIHLPEWYINGLVAFVSRGWTTQDDNLMRDMLAGRKLRNLNSLSGQDAKFAGMSLWHFIVETYGPNAVSNLLYMTRMNRNIENGFIYVIGANLKQLSDNWLDYYSRIYFEDEKDRSRPETPPVYTSRKQGRVISQVKISPDGNRLAWVTNDLGRYKVWLYDAQRKRKRKIAHGGYKSVIQATDLSYPAIAWHPSGKFLTSIREKKGKLWMDYHHLGKRVRREKNKFFYFDKVLSFSYSSTGSEMVLSAVQKGQSDIFLFNPRTRTYQQVTKDRWDDLQPRFVLEDRYIAFSSTRQDDTLRATPIRQGAPLPLPESTDLFLYDKVNRSTGLIRLTNTPGVDETGVAMQNNSVFVYLSDENGINNRYTARLDSAIAYIDTAIHYRYIVTTQPGSDYERSILEFDINSSGTRYAELIRSKNRHRLYLTGLPLPEGSYPKGLKKTKLRQHLDRQKNRSETSRPASGANTPTPAPKQERAEEIKEDSAAIDINNYIFQSEFTTTTRKKQVAATPATRDTVSPSYMEEKRGGGDETPIRTADTAEYAVPKQRNYELAFSSAYVMTQLDNNLMNETYQVFTGGAVYFYPGLNALFKLGINDLFDDYRIVGGFRLSGNLNSNEYYISHENLKKRLDRQISFYRQGREEIFSQTYMRIHTHELKYNLRWPFNDLASLRGTAAYRNDRLVALSTDATNLKSPNQFANWGSARVEFVYDNTISTGLNLFNGMRYKIFAEAFRQIDRQQTFMSVLGADFRHYLRIHRQIIWANRIAASTSFGDRKLVYYLGSTDNAFVPTDNFNYNIQIDREQPYAFQALATNMRGFIQNIRNGNSFALINSELRIPLFQYLVNRPLRSDLLRNFQIVAFGDIGTAWNGFSPYNKENPLFRREYVGNPISITVTKSVEPLVGGMGFGLRSRILGYFVRADWAWGIDDGIIQDRIFYFSLGLDF